MFISTQGQPDEFMERSGGRLFSLSNTNSRTFGSQHRTCWLPVC